MNWTQFYWKGPNLEHSPGMFQERVWNNENISPGSELYMNRESYSPPSEARYIGKLRAMKA
jgi:hypothetical protein